LRLYLHYVNICMSNITQVESLHKKSFKMDKIETATQRFYREILGLKPLLPKDYKIKLFEKLPKYDSYRGGLLLHAVINQRATDMAILEALKEIVSETQTLKTA